LSPEYLALNPKGKVPVLIVDGRTLTENVAILTWLATHFPEAELLPKHASAFDQARITADLAFYASLLHPIVTRLRIPQYFCDTPDGIRRVFALADTAMRPNFALIDQRLSDNEWWYGDRWSIMDAYINWVWFRVAGTDFDVSPFAHFARHDAAITQRPSVERALRRSEEAAAWLAERTGGEVQRSGCREGAEFVVIDGACRPWSEWTAASGLNGATDPQGGVQCDAVLDPTNAG
jgi:glutathione S-transferase